MCILSVYTFLKVVGYYDLSFLSMSVMGFKKKSFYWGGGGGGWGELYPSLFGFLEFCKILNRVNPGLTFSSSMVLWLSPVI